MNLTITGYSTALFSTWYFIEELGLLLDAGEGVSATLLQKARKIENVFITHADRDHLTGLFQFNQLNARKDLPIIHYPKECGSFPSLEAFTKKFDPHVEGTIWKPIMDKEKIWIKGNMYVEAIRNNHVNISKGIHKSFGYKIVATKQKLKAEYLDLSGEEIKRLIQAKGKEETHYQEVTNLLCYSGDTPVENFEHWNNSKILIHEATFMGGEEDSKIHTHGNSHSNLEDVMEAVSKIKVEKLILGHFSSRYSAARIEDKVRNLCEKFEITIPVFCILPGKAVWDILAQKPVNFAKFE